MQKRIYRFEIVRAVSNAVYQATDTARASSVTLYEWTPDARELERCLQILNGLAKSEMYEVFSSGASLYLAAATEQAGEAGLRRMREANLFKGAFGVSAPPPPPPPSPLPTVPAGKGRRAVRILLAVIATVIFITLLLIWRAS